MAHASNFTALRLFAMLMLLYGDGCILAAPTAPALWGAPLGRIGLDILFVVSGYLLTASWERRPGLAGYLARRVLRLFPALLVSVLFTILVIGPLATAMAPGPFFRNGLTHAYLENAWLQPELYLPVTFAGQGWNGATNGMLWPLRLGALCCLSVPLIAAPGRRVQIACLAAAAIASALAYLVLLAHPAVPSEFLLMKGREVFVELPFFASGALFWLLAGRREPVWRLDFCVACFAANWFLGTWLGDWNVIVEWLTLPYMALCFGRMSMPPARWLEHRFGDPSLGLFLYAFPIQQLVVLRLPLDRNPVGTCIALSLLAGLLSWALVERPTLARWRAATSRPSLLAAA